MEKYYSVTVLVLNFRVPSMRGVASVAEEPITFEEGLWFVYLVNCLLSLLVSSLVGCYLLGQLLGYLFCYLAGCLVRQPASQFVIYLVSH